MIEPAIITALIAGAASLLGALAVFKKTEPETEKLRAEAKKAVAEESQLRTETIRREIDTIRETYSNMLKDQLSSVVEPMEKRIDKLSKTVEELQKKNDALQKQVEELRVYRTVFEDAVLYIRSLCHWIDTLGLNKETKPKLPLALRRYFNQKGSK